MHDKRECRVGWDGGVDVTCFAGFMSGVVKLYLWEKRGVGRVEGRG